MRAIHAGSRRRWAAIASGLTLGLFLLGGGAAAAAAPRHDAGAGTTPAVAAHTDGGLVVQAGELTLAFDGVHYLGAMQVAVRNTGAAAVSGASLQLAVPAGLWFTGVSDGGGCTGVSQVTCVLFGTFAPGTRTVLTVQFSSFAGGQPFARITGAGTVAVTSGAVPAPRESSRYAGILRGTTGSVHHPRPYQPATTYDLALTAGAPGITRDADGTYQIRVPLSVLDRTDAINVGATITIAAPAGAGFPYLDPPAVCMGWCEVPGDWFAAGESRDFAVLFSLPADTAPGGYQVTVDGDINPNGPAPIDLTPADNTVTVAFTITG